MAPQTKQFRFFPISSTALKAGISLLGLIISAFLPYSVSATTLTGSSAIPDLPNFSLSTQNGNGSILREAFADDLFALPIVQQPDSNAGYVSTVDNTLTQFSMVNQFGNIGLLAHNYLSGQFFTQFTAGTRVQLIYGDGHTEYFQVTHVYRYRATSPDSVTSDFVDLDTEETLSASELFTKVYMGARHVTFQTCISQDGNSSWGRLFVIAEPEQLETLITRKY